jgi:hypothetical protein
LRDDPKLSAYIVCLSSRTHCLQAIRLLRRSKLRSSCGHSLWHSRSATWPWLSGSGRRAPVWPSCRLRWLGWRSLLTGLIVVLIGDVQSMLNRQRFFFLNLNSWNYICSLVRSAPISHPFHDYDVTHSRVNLEPLSIREPHPFCALLNKTDITATWSALANEGGTCPTCISNPADAPIAVHPLRLKVACFAPSSLRSSTPTQL